MTSEQNPDDDDLQARLDAAIEALEEWTERLLQAEFDRIAERYQQEGPADTFPWPNTAHPAYAGPANSIRRFMAEGRRSLMLPVPLSGRIFSAADEPYPPALPSFETRTLLVKRAWGKAPYVGDPFIYVWDVAADDMGRWVSGPTRIQPVTW